MVRLNYTIQYLYIVFAIPLINGGQNSRPVRHFLSCFSMIEVQQGVVHILRNQFLEHLGTYKIKSSFYCDLR